MSDRVCGIYKITNKVNGKVYIGQSNDIYSRWRGHLYAMNYEKYKDVLLYKAFKKYGVSSFSFDIVEQCAEEELNEREVYYIQKFNSYAWLPNCNGYNMTFGGDGNNGAVRTKEWNNKISEANKGNVPWNKGKKYSKPSMKGRFSGENNPFYGHHHTEEAKEKFRQARIGKPSYIAKPVICLNNGRVFQSIWEAHKETGANNTSIGAVCKGKRKIAGKDENGIGLKWMYYKDYLEEGGLDSCEKM